MAIIAVRQLVGRPGLFIRETVDDALSKANPEAFDSATLVTLDFTDIGAIAPGPAEQLIRGIKARLPADAVPALQLRILHAPPHTARTFTIVGRAHGMVLEERSETEWLLRPRDATDAG